MYCGASIIRCPQLITGPLKLSSRIVFEANPKDLLDAAKRHNKSGPVSQGR